MKKTRTWPRTALSIPVYALSILFWILTAKTIIVSAVVMLSRFVTPQRIGEELFNLVLSIAMAAIGSGLWILGRYIRTSSFKKQPKAVVSNLS
ncbi:MAG: hypothetical protein ACN6QY_27790 [Pseudomonas sp.]|uniref:hypothetical protein n=1 Tax=Pseudomonas sp. TaxID=306 RepID=UPI003D0F7DEA